MTSSRLVLLGSTLVVLLVGACGGGGGGGGLPGNTDATVTGVVGPGGVAATFHTGALPTPSGTLTVTVPPTNTAINGGSVMVTVDAGSTQIVNVYISVQGSDGYWSVAVPPGSTLADLLLTIARQLPASVGSITIVFEVQDAAGNISAPITMVIAVTHVGTGDLQVSLAFDVDNDLDLHVIDPNGFEVYWLDDTSPEGGVLDLDSNPGCLLDHVRNENIVWPTGTAPTGMYTVRVDNFDNCGGVAANYVVTVQKAGQPAQTVTGSFPATDLGDAGSAGSGTLVTQFQYP